MHGLGVPRSCQAAVLYYNPLAEQVVALSRYPDALPQVRKFQRLGWEIRRGGNAHPIITTKDLPHGRRLFFEPQTVYDLASTLNVPLGMIKPLSCKK